jgi:uncharacterized protein YecT (DUF1311 family)
MADALRLASSLLTGCLIVGTAGAALAEPASVDRLYSKAFNDCMNEAGGSTMPTRDCMASEHDAWDRQLNEVYQALTASRTAAQKSQLRDDERGWLKRTKRQCDHAGDDEAGGTLQAVEIDQCYLDETIRRTVYLRGLH